MKELAKKAIPVSLLSLLGAVSGLALDMTVISWASLSSTADAYFVALTVPQFVNTLWQVAIADPLVSAFVAWEKAFSKADTQRLISSTLTLWIGIAVLVVAIVILAVSPLIRVLGPGLDPSTAREATVLACILLPTIITTSASVILGAILNAAQHFAVPASGPFILYTCAVLTAYTLPAEMGMTRVAIGLLVGDGIRLLLTLIGCIALTGFRYRLPTLIFSPDVFQATKLIFATLSGHSIRYLIVFVERILGSLFGEGGVAALGYSSRIVNATSMLVFSSITVVALPELASLIKDKNYLLLKQTFESYTRVISIISIFTVTMFIGLSGPVIGLLFGEGTVVTKNVVQMVTVARIYGLGLLFLGNMRLSYTFLYALGDTRLVFTQYMVFTVLNLATSVVLALVIGIRGVAIGYPVAVGMTSYWGYFWIKRRLRWSSLAMINLRLVFPAAMTLVGIYASLVLLDHICMASSTVTYVASIVSSGIFGILIFLISLPIAGKEYAWRNLLSYVLPSRF